MKPVRVLLAIAGVAILLTGAFAIRAKILHDQNGKEITKRIAEFKAIKVPTNGGEFARTIPDEDNAWLTVGPLLMEKTDKGAKILYKSGIAMDLLYAGQKHDLIALETYLKPGEQVRETVANTMNRKSGFLVERNYDEGPFLLLPEFAAIKNICKDYVLAAFAKALQNDAKGAKDNLAAANRFAVVCLQGDSLISNLVGQSIRKMIYISAFRIQEEASPQVAAKIGQFMLSKEIAQAGDIKRVIQGEFIMNLATARMFDIPIADRPQIFYPLSLLIKPKELEISELEALAKFRHGDYIPDSRNMRTYLKTRLNDWYPLLFALEKYKPNQKLPDIKLFDTAIIGNASIPAILKDVIYSSDAETVYESLGNELEYIDVNRAMWTAINTKNQKGQYPKSLNEINIPIRQIAATETFSYKTEKGGIRIFGSRLDDSGVNSVVQLSYPVNLHRSTTQITRSRDLLNQFRNGEVDREGRLIPNKSKTAGP